jgi:hypothetical protein
MIGMVGPAARAGALAEASEAASAATIVFRKCFLLSATRRDAGGGEQS